MRVQANLMPYRQGGYFVRYNDGLESANMPKHEAKSYANIFGGKVVRDPKYVPEPVPFIETPMGFLFWLSVGLGCAWLFMWLLVFKHPWMPSWLS